VLLQVSGYAQALDSTPDSLSQVWGGPHPGLIHPQIEQRPNS